jgi:hypothetical protein
MIIFWCVVGVVVFLMLAYVLSRIVSIGYFRTRAEYDRDQFHKFFNGENDGSKRQ